VSLLSLENPLRAGLQALGLALSDHQVQQVLAFGEALLKWNKVYNLTAIRHPDEVLTHHLLDSLAVVKPLAEHLEKLGLATARVMDVGAGGGLPGVILAIALPQLQVLCVDSVGKKTAFIAQSAGALGLKNLRSAHSRVEALKGELPFDVVTSRAFSCLSDFVGLTAFHVKPASATARAGVWMAMKAKHPDQELAALPESVHVDAVVPLLVPGLNEERCLVWMS
jgi:16S rRNA (guanine527-N7)-methyltransferase